MSDKNKKRLADFYPQSRDRVHYAICPCSDEQGQAMQPDEFCLCSVFEDCFEAGFEAGQQHEKRRSEQISGASARRARTAAAKRVAALPFAVETFMPYWQLRETISRADAIAAALRDPR